MRGSFEINYMVGELAAFYSVKKACETAFNLS